MKWFPTHGTEAAVARLKPVKHDEHLSLVDHLDELRTRIIYSLVFLAAAFAVCFWQSDVILDVAAAPCRRRTRPWSCWPRPKLS